MQLFECEKCHKRTDRWNRCKDCMACDNCEALEKLCMYVEGVFCPTCWEKRLEKQIGKFRGSTRNTDLITCPWCGYRHHDSWEFSEGDQECSNCERRFEMSRRTETYYTTKKLAALNK